MLAELKHDNFYTTHQRPIMRGLDAFHKPAHIVLARHFGDDSADSLIWEMRRRCQRLLPHLPAVGGRRNRFIRNVIGAAYSLAFYQVLRRRGMTAAQIGALHNELLVAYFDGLPPVQRWLIRLRGRLLATAPGQRRQRRLLRRLAARSQARRYPHDFVFEFVEGDGETFDFGMNVTQCAICRLFQEQDAAAFTPYVCLYDYPLSALLGNGLVRTGTLAEGAECCDFRFRFGQMPENRQPTQLAA